MKHSRLVLLLAGASIWAGGGRAQRPAHYTCYRAAGSIQIDGKLDEPAWSAAPRSNAFVDIVTGKPAWHDTRVALLWDDNFLYAGYTVREPDVRAALKERDSLIYSENDVELFIAGKDAYYELELNALNTIYEVFWIWKDALKHGSLYDGVPEFDPKARRVMTLAGIGGHIHPRGERWGFLDWDFPGLLHAVQVNGTLNNSGDVDEGWTVELALPWKGMQWLADGRRLPPKSGDVWRIDCSRFEKFGPGGRPLETSAGWTWNRHGYYDSHIPETFPHVRFSGKAAGKR